MKIADFFSFVPLQIELFIDGIALGSASGFLYRKSASLYFVTNWHVLSGRDASTGQPLDKNAAIPNQIQILFNANPTGSTWKSPATKLEQEDVSTGTKSNWFQHPKGQKVDLACIRIDSIPSFVQVNLPTDHNCGEPMAHDIGSECYVVGFPLSHSEAKETVVWKRATIATEYDFDFRTLPCFLIDTTTSKGMSGSPVFLRQSGQVRYASGAVGMWTGGPATEFVGVYSGRYVSLENEPLSLGYVWRRQLIDEMIEASTLGTFMIIGKR